MFTGIIEETGHIKEFFKTSDGANITITCEKVLEDAKIGDSIAVNGVCQTIVNLSENTFFAQISNETLGITTLNKAKKGDVVNLERAMTLKDRIGGHLVSGHIDGTGKLVNSIKDKDFHTMTFEVPDDIKKYIIKKGSITINGISLTVADVSDNKFNCAVIPHTFENTNLKTLITNDFVNIEADVFAKYIEKFLFNNQTTNIITEDFLKENGFY